MTNVGRRTGLTVVAASAIGLATASPAAEPKPEGRAAMLQSLVDCRKLAEEAARLACYDAAVAAMEQAEAKGDIVVVDREQARAVRRQGFGFNLPSLKLFERGERPEEIDRVALKIDRATRDGSGKWTLRLEGGQTWRQIDTTQLMRDPKPGATVNIRKASLGSYMLSVEGARGAIRVHRDD